MTDRATLEGNDVSVEQVARLLRGRRSVDRFAPERPDDDIVQAAVEAARWAPNHRLTNPWRFYVLGAKTRDAVVQLNTRLVAQKRGHDVASAKDRRWRAVPGWLVVTCCRAEDELVAREDYAATACAIQNLMLYLHAAQVASKWTTGAVTRIAEFYQVCSIDMEKEYCAGLVWYGYAQRAPRSQRHSVEAILHRRD